MMNNNSYNVSSYQMIGGRTGTSITPAPVTTHTYTHTPVPRARARARASTNRRTTMKPNLPFVFIIVLSSLVQIISGKGMHQMKPIKLQHHHSGVGGMTHTGMSSFINLKSNHGSKVTFVPKVLLNIRGGGSSSDSANAKNATPSKKKKNLCKKYAKIGFIDLSSDHSSEYNDNNTDNNEGNQVVKGQTKKIYIPSTSTFTTDTDADTDTETTTASTISTLLHTWIQKRSSYNDNDNNNNAPHKIDIGTIYAIPSMSSLSSSSLSSSNHKYLIESEFIKQNHKQNTLTNSKEQTEIVGNIVESIGCIVNSIVVVYDTENQYRHSAIIRLLKGIRRQQRTKKKSSSKVSDGTSSGSSDSGSGSSSSSQQSIDLIFLANSDQAITELDAIHNVLKNDEDISNDSISIHIIPLSSSSSSSYLSSATTKDENKQIADDVMNTYLHDIIYKIDTNDEVMTNVVHIDLFYKLVQSVYSRLSGKKKKKKKGNQEKSGDETRDAVTMIFNTVQVEIIEDEPMDEPTLLVDVEGDEDIQTDNLTTQMGDNEPNFSVDVENTSTILDGDNDIDRVDVSSDEIDYVEEDDAKEKKEDDDEDTINLDEMVHEPSTSTPTEITQSIEEEKTEPVSIPSRALENILLQKSKEIIHQAETLLYELELKQDEVLLDTETKMPILQFGMEANKILKGVSTALGGKSITRFVESDLDYELVQSKRKEILSIINSNILRLFETQLQSLREFYGCRYEAILNELNEEISNQDGKEMDADKLKERREKYNTIMTDAAKQSTEAFRVAAQNAIPIILKEGELKEMGVNYTFEPVLDGLIRDMMHATSSSQMMEEEWSSVNAIDDMETDDASGDTKTRKRPARWYEKLAAKALVLSVNYAQGWLAMQGIRKAAAERDKMMPKFPMF